MSFFACLFYKIASQLFWWLFFGFCEDCVIYVFFTFQICRAVL